ncbi:MAG: glycosyltransferase family 39 protein [Gammaproteobacteria bacterium]|nr:glycosyltransferase family 39 protein [Gammaproteobacteria bacterium]
MSDLLGQLTGRFHRWLLQGSRRSHMGWLFALALLLIATGLGLRDPWPADEPRYALVAKEMVDTGQWLFPHVAGVLYPDKPPLFFWLQAIFYGIFGSVRWTFLLPSLLASLGTLYLVYDLGRRLWREHIGVIAALLLLASMQFVLQGRQGQIDATVCFWITLGMYGLLRHLLLGPQWRWYVTGFAAMGAGIITKGVGFLPVLVLLPWGLVLYRGWRLPRLEGSISRWVSGPVAMLAVIALWLVPMLYVVMTSDAPDMVAYRNDILLKQTAERYADSWHHLEPFWYYFTNVIPLFWFPLSLMLPWLVPAWQRRVKRGDARYVLLLGWVVLVLLFFSVSPGKRGVYILPALPMLALAAAPLLPGLLRKPSLQRTLFWAGALFNMVLLAALIYFTWLRPEQAFKLATRLGEATPWLLVGTMAGGGLFSLLACLRRPIIGVAAFLAWFWLVYGLMVGPMLNPMRSPAAMMTEVRERAGDSVLGLVGWKEQMALHADRPFVHFGFRRDHAMEKRDALIWVSQGDDRVLLLGSEELPGCVIGGKTRDLGIRHRQHWWLVEKGDLEANCRSNLDGQQPKRLFHVDHLSPYR